MSSFDNGRRAEAVVVDFLRRKGCEIVAQNWRMRTCEIDVVAQRKNVMYFCEVKYRAHSRQGGGLEYITPKKLAQMHFAAENWMQIHDWKGECQLCAIEVSGPDFKITAALKDL